MGLKRKMEQNRTSWWIFVVTVYSIPLRIKKYGKKYLLKSLIWEKFNLKVFAVQKRIKFYVNVKPASVYNDLFFSRSSYARNHSRISGKYLYF